MSLSFTSKQIGYKSKFNPEQEITCPSWRIIGHNSSLFDKIALPFYIRL